MKTDRGLRLAIVGGGTGGHVVPGLHMLGELLGASDLPDLLDLVWFETGRAAEGAALARLEALVAPLVPERCRLTLEPASGGAPSPLRLITRAPREIWRARNMLKRHRTDVVFGLGGFTLLPAVLAARSLGIPVVLLEINAVPGRAVAKLTPFATRVLHAWPRTMLPGDKHVLTGPPLGPALTRPTSAPTNVWRARLNVPADAPLLAVIGGSQGAHALNTFVRTHAAALIAQGVAIVHQVGPGRLAEAAVPQPGYLALEFVDDIVALLSETTVALTRAGASTLAELAVLGVPSLVVPFSGAGGHQRINADELGDAIRVVEEPELAAKGLELLSERLGPAGREWRAAARLELMARVPSDAAQKVAAELARFAKKK